jgi:hypothetical protein
MVKKAKAEAQPLEVQTRKTAATVQPKPKLKRARGALLRAINAGLVPPPPGYQGPQS